MLPCIFFCFLKPYICQVNVNHTADWWLGRLDDFWFEALENSVREEWGVEPLRIREGGVSHSSTACYSGTQINTVDSFDSLLGERIWLSCVTSPSGSKFSEFMDAFIILAEADNRSGPSPPPQ